MANLFRCGGGRSEASYQNLMDQLIEETATGPIASFTDGANNIPAKEIICHINPTETGTGEKSPQNPYVIGGFTEANIKKTGINLLEPVFEKGYINSTGDFISKSNSMTSKNYIKVNAGANYYFMTDSTRTPYVVWYDEKKEFISRITAKGIERTVPNNASYMKWTCYSYGTTFNNDTSINSVSTDTEYHAYTGDTYTVPFGQTVYGGTLNVTTGVLTVDRGYQDLGELVYTFQSEYSRFFTDGLSNKIDRPSIDGWSSDFLCECYKPMIWDSQADLFVSLYNPNRRLYIKDTNYTTSTAFQKSLEGRYLCYKLETPTTIQLTPTEVKTLLGANNIYHDCNGDIDVTYRANGALYVQEHPITRGLMAARPTEEIQEQEEQQEEKEINKSEDNER